jgi:trimeric autotransporter adhesin
MKNYILIASFFLITICSNSQVGVGTTTPNAALEVNSSSSGILIPRVTLTAKNVSAPVINPQGGLLANSTLIYNTVFAGVVPNNVFPGFYYWNSNILSWIYLGFDSNVENTIWKTNGNTITDVNNFFGTINDFPLTIKVNNVKSGRISRVRGDTFFGYEAGLNNTGTLNAGFGKGALLSNTSGVDNSAFGANSLYSNTTGYSNTALGIRSLFTNALGYNNTATGVNSLFSNTDGYNNTANGLNSLYSNTTGYANSAFGLNSLYSNSSGYFNTAIGQSSLNSNTTGAYNTASGYNSLFYNTTGNFNTANGDSSLLYNSTGIYNSAFGSSALYSNTTGSYNCSFGGISLYSNSIGNDNSAFGSFALRFNSTGNDNSAFGNGALTSNTSGINNVAIGKNALFYNSLGSGNTALGSATYQILDNLSNSTAIGFQTYISASNQIRVGNFGVSSIGGVVGWTTLSDKKFKKDIKSNVPGLDFIKKLRPVTYHLDIDEMSKYQKLPDSLRIKSSKDLKSKTLQTGFIAQEVEKAALESNYDFSGVDKPKNENDYYGLRYAEFVVPLVKSVQELQTIIEDEKKKNQVLQTKLKSLEERLLKLEMKN